MKLMQRYESFARVAAKYTGRPVAFLLAVIVVLVWAISGPIFHYSDTWQLVINTSTTIVTFLMVFLIQHSQNADTTAIQLKLDELIRVKKTADNALLNLEDLDATALEQMRKKYQLLAKEACEELEERTELNRDNDVKQPKS